MMLHTDAQLKEAQQEVENLFCEMEKLGISRAAASAGGKKFCDALSSEQKSVYIKFVSAKQYHGFVMKYRNTNNLKNALNATKPWIQKDPDQLDSNEYLLNTPCGTYDLRKGLDGCKMNDPNDFITKVTAVSPDETGKHTWEKALERIFCGGHDLIDYVQMVCGRCLIGKVHIEELVIAYSNGNSGKSTFWNTIHRVLGNYSTTLSSEILTTNCSFNPRPEFAELRGKRMVLSSEMKEDSKLNTFVLKKLCSIDPIKVEKKYMKPFDLTPSHTLILCTNHLHKITALDNGTWRRINVIPFHADFNTPDEIKNYSQVLFTKAGGAILSWLIEGAKRIIDAGFKTTPPQCVLDLTNNYHDSNNWFNAFLNARCNLAPSYKVASGKFYAAYREHCASIGESACSTNEFYGAVKGEGYQSKKTNKGAFIHGIRLKE